MSEHNWLRRRWKLVVNLVTLLALGILVYAIRDQLAETLGNLNNVAIWALLLIIPVEILNYHAQAKLFQDLFRIVGNRLSYKRMYKVALELNFVNHVFPSGGVTGISYFSLRMRDGEKLTAAKATLVNFMKLALTFLSFELIILLGVLALAAVGQVNNLVILVAGSLSTLLLVGTLGFFWLVEERPRINAFFTGLTHLLNKLIQIVRPRHPETINIESARRMVNDFHDNYKEIKSNYNRLKAPFWYAFLANLTEILAIYVVFIAFGEWVNIGAVILAYAIANFAGLISVLPGGIGVYEALMVGVLSGAGVPASVSLPVIVMYRVVNTLIQIPPGYYFYQKKLRQDREPRQMGSRG